MLDKKSFEEWNKRASKQIDRYRNEEQKRKDKFNRMKFKTNFGIFIIIAIPAVFLIWNGFSNQITTIKSCNAISTKKMIAKYSERDFELEMDYWSEDASDIYVVNSINGELNDIRNHKNVEKLAYMSTLGFYSSETPSVYSDYEVENNFDNFEESKEYSATVHFYNGMKTSDSIANYNKCLDYQLNQKDIKITMFYNKISSINY